MFTRLQNFYSNSMYRFRWNSTSLTATALTFLISLTAGIAIAWKIEQDKIANERYRISNIAEEYATDIQRNIERTLSITYAISALVQDYQGTIPNFKMVAQELLPLYPGASALALLPNNGDSKIVALPNTQLTINSDRLKNLYPKDIPISENSENTEELVLVLANFSNLNFSDGIGYLPIFLQDNQENSYFWGFATIAVYFPELFKDLHLEELENENIAYQLWQKNSSNQKKQIIAESKTSLGDDPVQQTINVSNTTWILSLTPVRGWKKNHRLGFKFLLAVAVSIILASIVKLLLDFKASALESEAIAYFDPLTSLPNRRLLFYRLETIILQTKRTGVNTVICHLDLDNFRQVNARLGRKAGDYILVRVAKRLQKFLRAEDVIARVGGDNFVIVLQGLSSVKEAELVIERIINAIVSPITIDDKVVSVSASIGVVSYPLSNNSIDRLLSYANQAMCYTKKNNKGSYTLFHNLKTTTT